MAKKQVGSKPNARSVTSRRNQSWKASIRCRFFVSRSNLRVLFCLKDHASRMQLYIFFFVPQKATRHSTQSRLQGRPTP
jgi:hypothetical protein